MAEAYATAPANKREAADRQRQAAVDKRGSYSRADIARAMRTGNAADRRRLGEYYTRSGADKKRSTGRSKRTR